MAATDAIPIPQKNVAYRVTFPIHDANGDPVASAGSLDSEVSLDGAAFGDCTNEATEIAQGLYYLELTAAEMNADTVVVAVKSDQKTTNIVIYPEEAGDIRVNATQIEGSDATDQINAAVDAALNTAIPGSPTADSINERIKAIDELTEAAGGGDLAAILADTNELQSDDVPGLIAALDTLIDAIKAKTDSLTFTVANKVDSNVEYVNGTEVTGSGTESDPWGP